MNKILIVFFALAMPVFASCPVNEQCTAAISSDIDTPLKNRLVPNRLENLKKTDAFQPQYITPYENMLINIEQEADYNSNCQFGVCLPERNQSSVFIE